MAKRSIKIITVLLCFLMILPCFTFEGRGAEDDSFYYCREALKSLPNSTALIYAYDKLTEGIASSSESIYVFNGVDYITEAEISIVFDAYRRDHTEHFWLGNSYEFFYNLDTVTSIKPKYILSGEELDTAKLEFESAIESILGQLTPDMTDYEKEKRLHDILASRVEYVESSNAHNAYGALVEGEAVCEGYAEALQCLYHRVGLQSLLVIGSSISPSTGEPEGHAWNMVKIDGEYYHVDLTWNDQGETLYYAYFNQTDSIITKDHTITEPAFALPSCDSTNANYFVREGIILSTYTADSVGELLKDNGLILRAYIPSGKDSFINWFKTNIHSIAEKAGITGSYGYSYKALGDEVILILDTCHHDNLTYVPKTDATCTENGNIAYYLCSCGKYFSDPQGNNEIIDKSLVTVLYGHVWTKAIEDSAHLRTEPESCAEYYTYFYGCQGCDEVSPDKYYTSDNTLPHTLTRVNRVESSCSTNGKAEYYTCICGKYFEDAEGKREITNINSYGKLSRAWHRDINAFGICTDCGGLVEITNTTTVLGLILGGAFIVIPTLITILKRRSKNHS